MNYKKLQPFHEPWVNEVINKKQTKPFQQKKKKMEEENTEIMGTILIFWLKLLHKHKFSFDFL